MVISGVDLLMVNKVVGHSDIQTTTVYARLTPDHQAEAVDRLVF